jgi:hypothetical protein
VVPGLGAGVPESPTSLRFSSSEMVKMLVECVRGRGRGRRKEKGLKPPQWEEGLLGDPFCTANQTPQPSPPHTAQGRQG